MSVCASFVEPPCQVVAIAIPAAVAVLIKQSRNFVGMVDAKQATASDHGLMVVTRSNGPA